jgi:hypothetical protein
VKKNPLWIKLATIIERTIEAMPHASPVERAKYTMGHEPEIIREWILQLLTVRYTVQPKKPAMIRNRPRLSHPGQGRLPGFENIPTQIYTKPPSKKNLRGTRVRLLDATLADQVASLELAIGQNADELADRRRLIALTRRYDRKQPGITVREVFKLQAARSAEAARKRATRARVRSQR